MHDELITALRTCVDKDKDCSECPYYERCMNNTSGKFAAMVDAADAIEERDKYALSLQHEMMAEAESHIEAMGRLNKQVEESEKRIKELSMRLHGDEAAIAGMKRENERMVRAEKPRWTPVTERLPDAYEEVLLQFPNNQAAGFCDRDGCWGVFSGDGFYTEVADNEPKPTHWAKKLPGPPKEGGAGTT